MGKRGGGILRDIYLLASFVCMSVSAAILFFLICRHSQSSNDRILSLIPASYQNDIGVFRIIIIVLAAFICTLSIISFIGSCFRSASIIKLGLFLTLVVVILEVALVGWMYFNDPTFEKTSSTIWNKMSNEQKEKFKREVQCNSEPSCRANIKKALLESHPKLLMFGAIGIFAFQLLTLVFGCCLMTSLRNSRKNYVYQYPTATIV